MGKTYTYTYKLFRVRKDGSIGSLFIDKKKRYNLKEWMKAKPVKTDGFEFRPGWHSLYEPKAPHLTIKGRHWFLVEIADYTSAIRPLSQGGKWYLSDWIRIIRPLSDYEMSCTQNYVKRTL